MMPAATDAEATQTPHLLLPPEFVINADKIGQRSPLMTRSHKRNVLTIIVGMSALIALGIWGTSGNARMYLAAEETTSDEGKALREREAERKEEACCKADDKTPPNELVAKTPKGELKSPYPDFAKFAEEGHRQFLRPGCNECHGGTGGGGICPPLTTGVWFWGESDDTLFRLVTLGSQELQKEGYTRLAQGGIGAIPMPPMGPAVKTADDLWKIIAWIRSINPVSHRVPPPPG